MYNLRLLRKVQRDGGLDVSTKVEEVVRPCLVVVGAGGDSWCSREGKKCSEGVLGSGVFFGLVRVRKYRMIVCFKVRFKRDCWIEYNECLSTSGCLK